MPSCVVLICGLPGSGKSTLIDHLTQKTSQDLLADSKYRFHIISYDQLIPLAQQEQLVFHSHAWKEKRKDILRASEFYICHVNDVLTCDVPVLQSAEQSFFDKLKKRHVSQHDQTAFNCFLVEDPFYYSSMRYEWYQVARKYGLGFCQVYLDCTLEEAVQRNATRSAQVPRVVIERAAERAEKPEHSRNKWESHSLILNANTEHCQFDIGAVVDLINKALENPLPIPEDNSIEKEQSQLACLESVIHQVDLAFRKLISQKMKSPVGGRHQQPKKEFQKFNEIKQTFMMKLKTGDIILPDKLLLDIKSCKTAAFQNQDLMNLLEKQFQK